MIDLQGTLSAWVGLLLRWCFSAKVRDVALAKAFFPPSGSFSCSRRVRTNDLLGRHAMRRRMGGDGKANGIYCTKIYHTPKKAIVHPKNRVVTW